ncbi:hypothetical protein LS482_16290 [Sinomicrobium kalidii]|uniref:lanthionine synthetase LanC family protein n=1 Tax=Sinomicrobium kalidii TaxID=2900738 RepID=UPI001E3F2E61|nr:lanthionine synthetase LanC family protein [Sinomicrobium kalidii]UGU15233.1 hypothetical protein LS482_16290 [Sinomicrobium kalidii]
MEPVFDKINVLNEVLRQHISKTKNIGLLNGKMGVSLYFFNLSKQTNDIAFQELAESLIMELYEEAGKTNIQPDFENGLAGIASGIIYLVNNNFVEADLDDILSDVEDRMYKYITEHIGKLPIGIRRGIMGFIFYYLYRLQQYDLTQESAKIYILKRILVDLTNRMCELMEKGDIKTSDPLLFDISWDLPISLVLLAKIRAMNFYTSKIDRILEYLSPIVLSLYPNLAGNRLYLLFGIESVLQEVNMPNWKKHADLLKKDLQLTQILNEEFRNKNIHFADGITGISFISKHLYNVTQDKSILFEHRDLLKKIVESEYWDNMMIDKEEKNNVGIFYGMSGIGLFLIEILKTECRRNDNSTTKIAP